ncbi:MAG TPA: prephenate dehydrogenase [Candidatus Acidoferrales bacterium]|nr:prephenate dehydrogenase [Candidatus Acidoferrales bacterium]
MSEPLPSFRRAAILGTGLIGGSFGHALQQTVPGIRIAGWDKESVLREAQARGAVHEIFAGSLAAAVSGADLVYISLPISATSDVLPEVARHAAPGALVTDACSTKARICRRAAECFRSGAAFLGGHPMAGKEVSGIAHADAGIFRGARYALMGSEDENGRDPRAAAFAALLKTMGAEPVWLDAETHDWAVAIVSHLPQLLSVALAGVVQEETDETGLPVSLAGPGLRDLLRLAGSPYAMWRDVALTNAENISRALDRLARAIEDLRARLTSRELESEFDAANELYKMLREMQ